jgi:hypothetical protein
VAKKLTIPTSSIRTVVRPTRCHEEEGFHHFSAKEANYELRFDASTELLRVVPEIVRVAEKDEILCTCVLFLFKVVQSICSIVYIQLAFEHKGVRSSSP